MSARSASRTYPASLAAAALIASLAPAAEGVAGVPREALECSSAGLDAGTPTDGLWKTLEVADRCADIHGQSAHQRAASLTRAAWLRLLTGDHSGAEKGLKRALALKPGDGEASLRLAQVLSDRPDEALRHAAAAARSDLPVSRRAAASRLSGELRLDLGDLNGARADLLRALELRGDDLETLQAMVRLERGAPRKASIYAERAARSAAEAPLWCRASAFRRSAWIWLELKDYAMATAVLLRALAVDRDDIDALEALIQIDSEHPRYFSGFGDLSPRAVPPVENPPSPEAVAGALETDPDDLDALRWSVAIHREHKRMAEAALFAARFVNAAQRAPSWQQPDAFLLAAQLWTSLGEAEKAAGALFQASYLDHLSPRLLLVGYRIASRHPEYFPRHPGPNRHPPFWPGEAYHRLARARLALKDDVGAERNLTEALELLAEEQEALLMLTQLKASQRQPAKALAYANRLVKASRASPPGLRARAYAHKAMAQAELGDGAGAEKSLEHGTEIAPCSLELIEASWRIGLTRRALADARACAKRMAVTLTKSSSRSAWTLKRLAAIQLNGKDFSAADDNLQHVLELLPDDLEVLDMLAQARLSLGRPTEALALGSRMVEACAGSGSRQRAHCLKRSASIQLQAGDPAAAEKSLKAALELLPDDSEIPGMLAQVQLPQDHPQTALDDAEALAYAERESRTLESASPQQRSQAYRRLASMRLRLKDEAGAENDLKRSLELLPEDAAALHALADLKLAQRQPEKALAYAQRLVSASENAVPRQRAQAYKQRALARLALKDGAAGCKDFERALSLAPGDLDVLWEILEGCGGRPRSVLALVERHRPESARSLAPWRVLRGTARALLGNRVAARKDFQAAVRIDPNRACFDATLQNRRHGLSPIFFDSCLERFPNDPALYLDRGVARYLLGEQEMAVADFQRALELRPHFLEARLSLATAMAAQNRLTEAAHEADKAAALAREHKHPIIQQIVTLQSSLRELKSRGAHKTIP